jgi:hypothetical protein
MKHPIGSSIIPHIVKHLFYIFEGVDLYKNNVFCSKPKKQSFYFCIFNFLKNLCYYHKITYKKDQGRAEMWVTHKAHRRMIPKSKLENAHSLKRCFKCLIWCKTKHKKFRYNLMKSVFLSVEESLCLCNKAISSGR